MNTFLALLQGEEESGGFLTPLLDFLTKPEFRYEPGARATATNWLMTGIVMVVLMLCAMQFTKWRLKERAIGKDKRWSLPRTFGFALIGLPVIFLLLLLSGYVNLDYWTFVGLNGIFKSTPISWVFYCICMVGCDLIFPWSRTDYGLR